MIVFEIVGAWLFCSFLSCVLIGIEFGEVELVVVLLSLMIGPFFFIGLFIRFGFGKAGNVIVWKKRSK